MELKTRYQYTYFIHTFLINKNRYDKYIARLLKDDNFNLRIFQKDKDLELYSYFLPRMRNFLFKTFDLNKERLEKLEELPFDTKCAIISDMPCVTFEYDLKKDLQGKTIDENSIFFKIQKLIVVCFNTGICFLCLKTNIEESDKFADVLNFNYKFRDINQEYNNLKNYDNIKLQADYFDDIQEIKKFIVDITGPNFDAIKIDLSSTEEGAGGEEVLALTTSSWERTSDFAARENCMVAINATPYDKTKLAGIYKVNGEILSGPAARYAALGLQCGADGAVTRARVFDLQTDGELKDFNYAFGGFFTVLEAGEVRQDFIRRTDSRSGAGISADGRTLYFLVVEGERTRHSIGLSYPQCGQVFRAMGCSDALEFDGGGSAELCINGQSVLSYKVRRTNGNSFGFAVN